METFKQNLAMVAGRIGQLSPSSRLLIGALLIILVMTLFLVGQYAAKPTLVALAIDPAEDARVEAFLKTSGVAYSRMNGKLAVPVGQDVAVLAQLTERSVVSANAIDFQKLVEQESPFHSVDQSSRFWLTAKMNVLSRMISGMSGVRAASVVIDEPRRTPGLGGTGGQPTATVNVTMRTGEMTQDLVDAVAATVAGAHAGLKLENVMITDAAAGRSRRARSGDDARLGSHLEHKLQTEAAVRGTIESALGYIPSVVIAVNAQVVTTEEERHEEKFAEPVVGPLSEKSSTSSSTNQAAGGEPAIRTNTGQAISGGGRTSQTSSEHNESKVKPMFPTSSSVIRDGKGFATKINASIGVPRDYFLRTWRIEQGDDAAQPDAKTLQPLVDREIERIRQQVEPLVDTDSAQESRKGTVVVTMISLPSGSASAGGSFIESAGMTASVLAPTGAGAGLVRTVVLGGLAAMSLFMMFMLVRRASSPRELPSASEVVGVPPALALAEESDLVGEADESAPPLEGMELDEESLRRKEMTGQLETMIRTSPSEVASVFKRYMRN